MVGSKYLDMMPNPERLPIILEKIKTLYLTEPNFTSEELGTIKTPTLILDGQDETVVRIEHAQEIANSIPNATLIILPNVGHAAVTEKPEVWNSAALDFLENK